MALNPLFYRIHAFNMGLYCYTKLKFILKLWIILGTCTFELVHKTLNYHQRNYRSMS